MTGSEAGTYKLIVDGAFDRAIACDADAAAVIGLLRRIRNETHEKQSG